MTRPGCYLIREKITCPFLFPSFPGLTGESISLQAGGVLDSSACPGLDPGFAGVTM
jgi:hypothetical protein